MVTQVGTRPSAADRIAADVRERILAACAAGDAGAAAEAVRVHPERTLPVAVASAGRIQA